MEIVFSSVDFSFCDMNHKSKAKAYCKECHKFLCENCFSEHESHLWMVNEMNNELSVLYELFEDLSDHVQALKTYLNQPSSKAFNFQSSKQMLVVLANEIGFKKKQLENEIFEKNKKGSVFDLISNSDLPSFHQYFRGIEAINQICVHDSLKPYQIPEYEFCEHGNFAGICERCQIFLCRNCLVFHQRHFLEAHILTHNSELIQFKFQQLIFLANQKLKLIPSSTIQNVELQTQKELIIQSIKEMKNILAEISGNKIDIFSQIYSLRLEIEKYEKLLQDPVLHWINHRTRSLHLYEIISKKKRRINLNEITNLKLSSSIFIQNIIFICGGKDLRGISLEVDLPTGNKVITNNMLRSVFCHGLTSVRETTLFSLGGYNRDFTNFVQMYSINAKEWSECPKLTEKKSCVSGITLNNRYIFCIGGTTENSLVNTIEKYDFQQKNQIWKKIIIKKNPKWTSRSQCFSCTLCSNKLLIYGGYSKSMTKDIFLFDNESSTIDQIKSKKSKKSSTIHSGFLFGKNILLMNNTGKIIFVNPDKSQFS